jgi:phytoene dehydrogenase-like protein
MTDVLIVGAGLAGLSCACNLAKNGLSPLLLEASDGLGGRARTDHVDGFLLDRGFQVLLTAYPEAQKLLDYAALQLRWFEPGALVRFDKDFHRIADPWRRPSAALTTLFSPVGTFADKLKLAKLRGSLVKSAARSTEAAHSESTIQFLRDYGFSPNLIERFFRPFLGGIFLERDLATASPMFDFVFRMFSTGDVALPAGGMGTIAEQLASRLPEGAVQLQQTVVKVEPGVVTLASGKEIKARSIVVATDRSAAARLLPEITSAPSNSTTCFYFAAEKTPVSEPILVLNGTGEGPINNLCVPSRVSASYAPKGLHLISASVIGNGGLPTNELLHQVEDQLTQWFGEPARHWRYLRSYWIPDALPQLISVPNGICPPQNLVRPGIYVCGDYRETASINGALISGRKTAEAILENVKARNHQGRVLNRGT